jgi:signal peptidase II
LVTNVLELRYTQNHDVGFSLLRRVPERVRTPLIYVGSIAGLAFLGLLWSRRRGAGWPEHLAYAVILSGAIGNLTDRMIRGYVVDFVYLHHWPVFNVADAYLVVGGALLLLSSRDSAKTAGKPPVPSRAAGA